MSRFRFQSNLFMIQYRYLSQSRYPTQFEYNLLGIKSSSNIDEIRKSYLKLAKKYHPDRYQSKSLKEQQTAHNNFIKIQNAYQIIMEYKKNPHKFKSSNNYSNENSSHYSNFYGNNANHNSTYNHYYDYFKKNHYSQQQYQQNFDDWMRARQMDFWYQFLYKYGYDYNSLTASMNPIIYYIIIII